MTGSAIWLHVALAAVSVLSLCCIMALLAQELRTVFRAFFGIFYGPISQIRERLARYLQSAQKWLLAQIADESDRAGDGPLYFIIGSVLYTLLTVLFILCDFGMVVVTLQAMGMEDVKVELPMDTSTLTGATLVTTALFWGAILFDLLGVTRLAPWRKNLSEFNRRLFIGIAVFFVSVTVFIGGAMAYWRGWSLLDVPSAHAAPAFMAENHKAGLSFGETAGGAAWQGIGGVVADDDFFPPDDSHRWVVLATLTGISGVSLASTAFSMVGLGIMVKFAILLVITLGTTCLLPVSFCSWLATALLNGINFAIESVLDFFVAVGNGVLGLFRGRSRSNPEPVPSPPPASPQAEEVPAAFRSEAQSVSTDPGFNPFDERR